MRMSLIQIEAKIILTLIGGMIFLLASQRREP